jgi:hypothetical protein
VSSLRSVADAVKILSEKIARFREKIAGTGLPPH